jgi:hypothetical protein
MAAAARQARSRLVADRAADVLEVLLQVQAEGVSGLRSIAAAAARARRAHTGRQEAVVARAGPEVVGPLRGDERDGVSGSRS